MPDKGKKIDCLIIGAGLSGMAAAVRLSHFGKKILLLEKNANIGGLNTFYFKNGVEIDSGLHAMTNFCVKNSDKSLPLNKLLRQLRIAYDELELVEQIQSEIRFPSVSLFFDNDFSKTKEKFKKLFPESAEGFERLSSFISAYQAFSLEKKDSLGARSLIRKFIGDKRLEDMLLLPLMYYGSAREKDMEISQFVIMFRSIFTEGFCRPEKGIKTLLGILEKKLADNSCEIRRKTAVLKILPKKNGEFEALLSDSSSVIAEKIISSIGANETLSLLNGEEKTENPDGQMAFVEAVFCLKNSKEFSDFAGIGNACTFFCGDKEFVYKKPSGAFSAGSGVLCCPANFKYRKTESGEHLFLRLTALANYEYWLNTAPEKYQKMKSEYEEEAFAKIAKLTGLNINRDKLLFCDVFTPKTILRWTGHKNGAIYGCPEKFKDGMTKYENLYLCGTDQGFWGITGSLLSGISIANKYALP